MTRFLLITKFCEVTGYSLAAVNGKIATGEWREGVVWRRAPDGHRMIDIEGYNEWVINENGMACAPIRRFESRPLRQHK